MGYGLGRELSAHYILRGPAHKSSAEGDGIHSESAQLLCHLNQLIHFLAAPESVAGVELGCHRNLAVRSLYYLPDTLAHKVHPVV